MGQIRTFDPDWTAPSGSLRLGLAYPYETPADVDRAYKVLVVEGYDGHKASWDAFWDGGMP